MSGVDRSYPRLVGTPLRPSLLAEAVSCLSVDALDEAPDAPRNATKDALDDRLLRRRMLDTIGAVVPFDYFAFVLTDPETAVGGSPLAHVPDLATLPRLIRLKYLTGPGRWTRLPDPGCSTLRAVMGSAPGSTSDAAPVGSQGGGPSWVDALTEQGVSDVLLAVLRDRHGTWAFLDLWRREGAFRDDEVVAVRQALPALTSQLRAAVARTFVAGPAPANPTHHGPGILLLTDDLVPVAGTPQLDDWLATLLPAAVDAGPVPASAFNVAAQLLAVEAGVDDHRPSTRVAVAPGTWLTISAGRLNSPSEGASIAVGYEIASAADRLEVFVRAHGLSARERDVVRAVATGADTRGVSRRLGITELTVQDHLKSVFARTGAASRADLLARALGT
jgi:DNA-binding CsgD family transcriptional regulator